MTKDEFDAWSRETARRGWKRDEVTLQNRGVFLIYHGGESGTYVQVDGATVEVGRYEGAVPHIGEATFVPRGRRKFRSRSRAFEAVAASTGTRGLLALLTGVTLP